MKPFADKTYLRSKIIALRPTLLNRKKYSDIIRRGTLPSAFPDLFSPEEKTDVTPAIEAVFRREIILLLHLMEISNHYLRLFGFFLLMFEVENIKSLAARTFGREDTPAPWYDVSPRNLLNRSIREETLTPNHIREILEPTIFRNALEKEQPTHYESLEIRLDSIVLQNLIDYANKLRPRERSFIMDTITWKSIILRKTWEIRMQYYYGSQRDKDIEGVKDILFLPSPAWSGKGSMERLIEKKLLKRFPGYKRPKDFESISLFELYCDSLFINRLSSLFSNDLHGITPILSFAWQFYYQIRNLLRITEGLYYNISPEKIERRIIAGK